MSKRTGGLELVELARERFGREKEGGKELGPVDRKLFESVAKGELADFSEKEEENNDPEKAGDWGPGRVIEADRIEWLCTDPEALQLVTHRGIWVKGARVDGELILQFARIPFAIDFWRSAFGKDIYLQHAEVRGLNLAGTHTQGIWADSLKVEGSVFLRDGFKAKGEVRLLGARIGGNLDCMDGQFINENRKENKKDERGNKKEKEKALFGDGLKVEGSVFLHKGFKAKGEVRLLCARIGGDLDCENGQFINENKNEKALFGDGLKVEGNVFFRKAFEVEGKVSLVRATIDGGLQWWGIVSRKEVELDLRLAKIGVLYDKEDSWPEESKLWLHGLVYDEIGDEAPTDSKRRLEWLGLQGGDGFRPQPYEQLAGVLKRQGKDKEAEEILIAKNEDRAKREKLTWPEKCWYYFFGRIIGYGYRPWRALWVAAVIVVWWIVVFELADWGGVMKHTQGKNHPEFNVVAYSVDAFAPLVDLQQVKYWLPNGNEPSVRRFAGFCGLRLRWGGC